MAKQKKKKIKTLGTAGVSKKAIKKKALARPTNAGRSKNVSKKSVEAKPALLSGGSPQIAKAEGDEPVQRYIAAMPGWKREIGRKLDEIIAAEVPGVLKAVKWNSPFYGVEGQGWFVSFHVFARYVKVTFFKGTSLTPAPQGGKGKDARWFDIRESDFDERQFTSWVKQASRIPGWSGGRE